MDTKIKGDVAEIAATLEALTRGWGVLQPVGDRLSYDLVFDIDGVLMRIQVKSAWRHLKSGNYVVDTRRTRTNRRRMTRKRYTTCDFDFALIYLADPRIFYVIPCDAFIAYGSEIHMVEQAKRQRKPASAAYRDAWQLISQRAAQAERPA